MQSGSPRHYDIDHGSDKTYRSQSALLLTGGMSSRMGSDKSKLMVGSEQLAHRLARLLRSEGWEPIILGPEKIDGYASLPDKQPQAGPLSALKGFKPVSDLIFILSCDVPLFNPEICGLMSDLIGEHDAVIPQLDQRSQPLCALYSRNAWHLMHGLESNRVMDWIGRLSCIYLNEDDFEHYGLSPNCIIGANTPDEFNALVKDHTFADS